MNCQINLNVDYSHRQKFGDCEYDLRSATIFFAIEGCNQGSLYVECLNNTSLMIRTNFMDKDGKRVVLSEAPIERSSIQKVLIGHEKFFPLGASNEIVENFLISVIERFLDIKIS